MWIFILNLYTRPYTYLHVQHFSKHIKDIPITSGNLLHEKDHPQLGHLVWKEGVASDDDDDDDDDDDGMLNVRGTQASRFIKMWMN